MDSPRRVLVVEDEPLIGMMVENYLDELGMEVVGVVDCVSDALRSIDSEEFDVALVDVNLKGGENCDPVAVVLDQRNIPFIMTSGDCALPDRWAGRPMLPKPYTMSDVERVFSAV